VLGDTAENLNESLHTPSADDFHSEAHSVEPATTQAAKSAPVAKTKSKPAASIKSRTKSKPAAKVKAKTKAKPGTRAKAKATTKKQAS
jgi:hypothetical protein